MKPNRILNAPLLALTSILLLAPSANAGGSINNFLDGFTYQAEDSDAKERIVAAKDPNSSEGDTYSVMLELIESGGNEFVALVNDQIINSEVNKQGVIDMLGDTFKGKALGSALRIDYELSKHELLSLYGENSLLADSMIRCGLSTVKLRIEIEGEEFRFISPQKSQVLSSDTLHELSFCD